MHRRVLTLLLLGFVVAFCACEETQRGTPWLEQLDGGAVDAPGPPPDVPDTSDVRPDIEVPPAPDCQQTSTSLPAQVKRLSGAEMALTVDASTRKPKVSPNGCYVGFKTPNGEVRIIDLTGEPGEWTVRNPAVGADIGFQAMAFSGPAQDSVWVGTSGGSIHHLSLENFSHLRSFEPPRGFSEGVRFEHLDVGANDRFVAWAGWANDLGAEMAGVYDLERGQHVQRWETSGGVVPIEFVPGRSFLIVRAAEDGGTVEIFDPAADETPRTFDPRFIGDRSSVWAATQTWFAITHVPEAGATISRLDFDSWDMTVVDPSPRPSHYHDLYASPSGRWLLQWNFEHSIPDESEGAIRRYDMLGDRPPLQFGHSLLGFGGTTDLVFGRISNHAGLEMYDPENGEALGTIGAFDGRNVSRVVGISANRLAVQWRSDDATKLSILTGSAPNR